MKRIRRLFQSIHFKIPIQIIIILLIAFQFVGVYFVNQYESRTLKNYQDQIDTQVEFLVNNVTPILETLEWDGWTRPFDSGHWYLLK